jgi:RNA polymerase sigma-70 factor (ECF subfamily)
MTYLPTVDLGDSFAPFAWFRDRFGFVPNLFRAQSLLPRAIEAEAEITRAILAAEGGREGGLSRAQKECILLAIAGANRSSYCVAAHREILRSLGMAEAQTRQIALDHRRAGLIEQDAALLDFALKLAQCPTRLAGADIEGLRRLGLTDEQILDAVLVSGLTKFMCTLSLGLGVKPDFEPPRPPARAGREHWTAAPSAYPAPTLDSAEHGAGHEAGSPAGRLRSVPLGSDGFPPFAFLRRAFGFVPNIFRAQTLHPEALAAEVRAVRDILLTEDLLSRVRKEYLLLVVSAANLNTYCVAVHCGMLRNLGIPEDRSDQIALDHRRSTLPAADKALLDFALRLNAGPGTYKVVDIARLRRHGFSGPQIVEAIVMTALTNFLNTIQMGLQPTPDFPPRIEFQERAPTAPPGVEARPGVGGRAGVKPRLHPQHPTTAAAVAARATSVPAAREEDPDADCVAPAQRGDLQAFETLVRRHSGRLYQTLYGITGDVHDAEDGLQNSFIKAFRCIGQFQGEARFSTWLTRIAINEGLQRLRRRREVTSLDDTGEDGEFRPREVRDWRSDPEQECSRAELRALVERALVKLPPRYRTVVVLRDLEQMSTEEAAQALGLGVPALKTRLFRGRLMLREELARHFAGERQGRTGV